MNSKIAVAKQGYPPKPGYSFPNSGLETYLHAKLRVYVVQEVCSEQKKKTGQAKPSLEMIYEHQDPNSGKMDH